MSNKDMQNMKSVIMLLIADLMLLPSCAKL